MRKNTALRNSGIILIILIFFCNGLSLGELSRDAIIITLRNQESVWLDSVMAGQIDSALTAIREKIDTLNSISARRYYLNEIIIKTDASWSSAWYEGKTLTGEHYIDSLSIEYGIIKSKHHLTNRYILSFGYDCNIELQKLCELYELHPDVIYATPNHLGGDGNNIEYFKKDSIMYFIFSRGWGDCLCGCIYRYYWYVSAVPGENGYTVQLEEEKDRDFSQPYIFRWNIPERYSMTMCTCADSIFQIILNAPEWWARRHAVEGVRRFFEYDSPWAGEDNNDHWYELKAELLSKRAEALSVLKSALNDPDPDVRASAENAVSQLETTPVDEKTAVPQFFSLHQNFPNPFNMNTTIRYQISKTSEVRIIVYNISGQMVRGLVNEYKEAGFYTTEWDGKNNAGKTVSSGLYFCRMQSGEFTKTMKMLLLK